MRRSQCDEIIATLFLYKNYNILARSVNAVARGLQI